MAFSLHQLAGQSNSKFLRLRRKTVIETAD